MSTPVAIFAFVVMLSFLIFIHELGHFITAKWRGVKVLEFGMGFPPRAFAIRRGETEYSLNWLPIGGFCKMLGEDDPTEPRSLASQSTRTRLLVLSAGSLMMFLFPIILFAITFMVPHNVITGWQNIAISDSSNAVVRNSPADLAGAKPGDIILSINGQPVKDFASLKAIIDSNLGQNVAMEVQRAGQNINLTVYARTPAERPANEGSLGIAMSYVHPIRERQSYPFWEAIPKGATESWRMVTALYDGIRMTVSGDVDFKPTGVIGMGQVTQEVAKTGGVLVLIGWAGLLSLNLGIMNLLPLPALDGGRIAFVIIEIARRGKRISPSTEAMVHLVGFMMLIGLMVVVGYYDVLRIVSGGSVIPK